MDFVRAVLRAWTEWGWGRWGDRSLKLQALVQVEEGNDTGGQCLARGEQARTALPQLSGVSGEWILKGAKRPCGKWIPQEERARC